MTAINAKKSLAHAKGSRRSQEVIHGPDSPGRSSDQGPKSIDEEIKEASDSIRAMSIAKRHDPIFRDDAIEKVKYIYEDYRRSPIEKNQLVQIIMNLIKQEIEY